MNGVAIRWAAILFLGLFLWRPAWVQPSPQTPPEYQRLIENGGRVDWLLQKPALIAFDRLSSRGYYDVYTMRPDGSGVSCVTCDARELPSGHRGNPAWHSSGRYLVFQAEKSWRLLGRKTDYLALPGLGSQNDLWICDFEARKFWKVASSKPLIGGILHPHFSQRSNLLLWTERLENTPGNPAGIWGLRVATFKTDDGTPRLTDIQTMQPLGPTATYEGHDFSPDGSRILFTGSDPQEKWGNTNIYLYDLRSHACTNLTNGKHEWSEHAHFSPDGKVIAWISSKNIQQPRDGTGNPLGRTLATDLWLMNAGGKDQWRLTFFNDPASGSYQRRPVALADNAWSPDGQKILVYMITGQTTQVGEDWLIPVRRLP